MQILSKIHMPECKFYFPLDHHGRGYVEPCPCSETPLYREVKFNETHMNHFVATGWRNHILMRDHLTVKTTLRSFLFRHVPLDWKYILSPLPQSYQWPLMSDLVAVHWLHGPWSMQGFQWRSRSCDHLDLGQRIYLKGISWTQNS